MALVSCDECGKSVSTQATSCPHCGAPALTAAVGSPVRTIELTSKRLKLHSLISGLVFLVGLVWVFAAGQASKGTADPAAASAVPAVLLTVGMIWFVVTKFRIWWHHK